MIVNYAGCDEAEGRQPWIISGANYTDTDYTVTFAATKKTWPELNNDMAIEWGGNYVQPTAAPQKRLTGSVDHSFDLTHSLNANLYSSKNHSGLDFDINCANCGSKGSITVEGSIKTTLGSIESVTLSATPNNIEVDLGLQFVVSGTLGSGWTNNWNLLSIPIDGFKILELVDVG